MTLPKTTLFMLISCDGKISTGSTDALDFDKDLPRIVGVREGLEQYYAQERLTDYWSLNTGKVMAKVGVNRATYTRKRNPALRFVIIDNKPHLTKRGVRNLASALGHLYIVTTNRAHPAAKMPVVQNLTTIIERKPIDFRKLFSRLSAEYGAKRITVQSGGTLNAMLLREGLIDELSIVIAPVVIGGAKTPTLVDGTSLISVPQLPDVKALKLLSCTTLQHSYLHVRYAVVKKTRIMNHPGLKPGVSVLKGGNSH
jgi:2,5-diamino-6-(ribosylamino)-4(3H)-pyrimidinone 5'-phosphate reductase